MEPSYLLKIKIKKIFVSGATNTEGELIGVERNKIIFEDTVFTPA